MANSNTFVEGFTSGGEQVTTLSQVQGSGLSLPSGNFINIRSPGKIEALFSNNGNAEKLYSVNKPEDVGLSNVLKHRFDYKNPNQGQKSKTNTTMSSAAQDANLVRKYLGSNKGFQFIGKQLILQGYQAFDETKVYNPASPLIATLKPASFGLLDSPTRHLDTSNIIGGLVNSMGLGSVVSTIGGFLGGGPPVPPPPRSSVASTASRPGGFLGINTGTFSSLIGGGDRSDEVVTSIARNDVKDLLRGNTATNAYNAPRYSRWINSGGGGFFSKLLTAAGKFIQNKTLLGGILPPKQPWAANYRADEETYDMMLNSGKMFSQTSPAGAKAGIVSGLLNSIGFGKKTSYSLAVPQRFYSKSKNPPDYSRLVINGNYYAPSVASVATYQSNQVGILVDDGVSLSTDTSITVGNIKDLAKDGTLKYGAVVGSSFGNEKDTERSDQLFNYKVLVQNVKDFKDQFSDPQSREVQAMEIRNNILASNIGGFGSSNPKYSVTKELLAPIQFAKFGTDNVGMSQVINDIDITYLSYAERRAIVNDNLVSFPLRVGKYARHIRPTNDVDYVNALEVLSIGQFKKWYSETDTYGVYGPDIIKFFFYDIVNKNYIPFNATVKSLTDNNQAQWESIEYLGRPDKLYYYKGFTRSVSFNFTVNAHSIKELMPMWNRINYLVGLTRPANYTMQAGGGFMISPMVQLTLGDFYKNHNVVINSCNVSIPDEASWETIPEEIRTWSYGPSAKIAWEDENSLLTSILRNDSTSYRASSEGRFSQFPRTADIQIEMNVLEKDRPKTGRAIWGDAPVANVNGIDDISSNRPKNFSTNIRHDNDVLLGGDPDTDPKKHIEYTPQLQQTGGLGVSADREVWGMGQ